SYRGPWRHALAPAYNKGPSACKARSRRRCCRARSDIVDGGKHGARNVRPPEAARGEFAVRQGGQRLVAERHRARLLDAVEEAGAIVQQPLGQAGSPGKHGGKGESDHIVASDRICCEFDRSFMLVYHSNHGELPHSSNTLLHGTMRL